MNHTSASGAILLLLLCLLLPGSVLAQDARDESTGPDYSRSGFYVWLGAGIGISTKAEDQLSAIASAVAGGPVPVKVSSAAGFNGRIGMAGGIISSELQFEYLPGFEASVLDVPAAEWSLFTMTGNLKLQLPAGQLQPYALVGGGSTRSTASSPVLPGVDQSFWGGAVRAGGGLDLYVTEHVALAADATYVIPFGDNEDLDYVSIGIGLIYKF